MDPQSAEIEFPENVCQLQSSINELVSKVYPNIETKIPGNIIEYNSIDTMTTEDEAVNYPTEFLNSLQPTGMPPHILKLKVGAILTVLRNLNPPKLCNGTRVIVKKLTKNLIEARILTGKYKGEEILIPRIPIISTDMPFEFKRMQFPVKLAFAMTINKAQGQTLKVVGLNLTKPCFSHGQLYVGCSRVGIPEALFIYTPNGKTKNIVYPLALE